MTNWQTKKLGDVSKIYDGTHQTPTYVENGVPFYSVEQVTANDFSRTKFITEEVFEKESKRVCIEKGDILMTRIGDIGTARYVDWDVRASFYVSLALIKCNNQVDAKFLAQAINSYKFQKELWKRSLTVAFPYKINLGDIGKSELLAPSKAEQRRIVAVLEVWDEYLELLDRKIALKEQLKKGLMQQLLTGKKRLPGFTDEWRSVAAGDFLKERKEYASKDGKYEHISLTTKGVVPKTARYERDFLVMAEDKQYRITKIDDICYNPANLKFGVIARNKYKTAIFSPIYVTYEVRGQDVSYIEHLVTSYTFIGKALRYEEGTVYERMAVHPNDLAVMKISLPSIVEQRAISNIIDTHELEYRTLVSLKNLVSEQKKYLLKNLISGTIRTPENLHIKGAN